MYGELSQKLVEWIQVKVMDAALACWAYGGVDSAVVALRNRALHGNVLGSICLATVLHRILLMRLIAEKLDINYAEINLEKAYDCIMETYGFEKARGCMNLRQLSNRQGCCSWRLTT